MKRNILLLFFSIIFSGFFTKAEAQCPPTLTLTGQPLVNNVTIVGNNVSMCPGEAVQLDATPSAGVTYKWYKDGNLFHADSIYNHFWAKEVGSYTLVVTGSGCATPSAAVVVTHKAQPNFAITSNPFPPHICAQEYIALTVIPSPFNAGWVWITPSVSTDNPLEPDMLSSSQTFMVIGTHPTTSCTNSSSIYVTVDGIINGGTITNTQTICSGTAPDPITF